MQQKRDGIRLVSEYWGKRLVWLQSYNDTCYFKPGKDAQAGGPRNTNSPEYEPALAGMLHHYYTWDSGVKS